MCFRYAALSSAKHKTFAGTFREEKPFEEQRSPMGNYTYCKALFMLTCALFKYEIFSYTMIYFYYTGFHYKCTDTGSGFHKCRFQ
jgi:hypothetical protein